MKITFKLFLIFLTLSYSCSKATWENEKESDVVEKEESRLVSKIKSLNTKPWEKHGDTLIYKENQLRFSLLEGENFGIQYYEYNEKGKISEIYHGGVNRDVFNPNTFNVEEFKKSESTVVETYIYGNNFLTERHWIGYIYYFSYDELNRLKSVDQFDTDFNRYYEIWVFNYNDENIGSIRRDNVETGNSTIYTYEFDEKINPFYVLKEKFGLVELETSRAINYNSVDGMIFKNNVAKLYENGKLIYSASLEYEDEYPTRISWINHETDASNIEIYFYK